MLAIVYESLRSSPRHRDCQERGDNAATMWRDGDHCGACEWGATGAGVGEVEYRTPVGKSLPGSASNYGIRRTPASAHLGSDALIVGGALSAQNININAGNLRLNGATVPRVLTSRVVADSSTTPTRE